MREVLRRKIGRFDGFLQVRVTFEQNQLFQFVSPELFKQIGKLTRPLFNFDAASGHIRDNPMYLVKVSAHQFGVKPLSSGHDETVALFFDGADTVYIFRTRNSESLREQFRHADIIFAAGVAFHIDRFEKILFGNVEFDVIDNVFFHSCTSE